MLCSFGASLESFSSGCAASASFGVFSWGLAGLSDAEPADSSRELVSALYPGLSMGFEGTGEDPGLFLSFSTTGNGITRTSARSRDRLFILLWRE